MLLKNARKGNGSGPELRFKNQSPRRSSIVDLTSFRRLFRAEAQREREKKKTRVSSSAINPNGPFSRPLVASLDYVVPYSLSERTHHPPLPSPPRVSANAWIHEIRGGIQARASRFLGSVPAPYKLPSLWHPVFTFFSPPPPPYSLLSLFDGRTRRRTAIITTMTDSDDRPTNHVNTINNNKNDRPGSEAWRYRNSHRGHRGREWGEGRRGTASGARNSRAERGESFVFRNYERTGRWKGDLG